MILQSKKLKVTKPYFGKSKFDFWKNISFNDLLVVSFDLKPTGRNRGRIYAPDVAVHNITTGEQFSATINKFQSYFDKIEYEEIKPIKIK